MAKPQNHRPLSNQVHQVHQASQARDMESTYASGGVHLDARYSPARLPYGRVVDVVGDAWVRDPVTLELRKLVAGDVIERASVVLTDQNGIIQIEPQRGPLVPIVPLRVNSVQRALPEVDPAQKVVPGSLTDAYRVDRIHESVDGNQYDLAPALVAPQGAGAQGHAGGVGVAVNSVTVNEGAGTATFTIQLDHMADGVVRVGYSTRDGDATAGVDFGGAAGVLVFQPGEVSKTITVPIFNDNVFEGAEDFRILLTPAPGAWESLLSTGVGTIMDDGSGSVPAGVMPDNDTPVVSIIGVVVNEASPFAEFRVTLSNPAKMPVTVSYASADGMAQAGADYIAVTGVITFAPGELEHVIRVPILNDDVYEGAESFSVLLSEPVNALVSVPKTTATILDDGTGPVPSGIAPDDDRPHAAINDVVFNEAAGTATFTVTLAGTATTPITIDYATAEGTAKAGLDYAAVAGTLTFAPGETSKTISVPILNDNVYEGSEAFAVNLSNPSSNALIADPSGLGTIKDDGTGMLPPGLTPDDDRPVVSINDVLVNEASAKATFTVTLSNASDLPVTIKYGSVNGTAEAGSDYDAVLGTLTFAPGELTKTIDVPLHNDTVYEGAESFQIVLTDPTNAKVIASGAGVDAAKDGTGIGTIKDDGTGPVPPGITPDNDIPAASIDDIVVNEAAGTATFTVTLTNAAKMPVTVDYATADGTAKAGMDYAAVTGTLTFAPGETSKTITVSILNDTVYEGSEAFTINLSAPANATITDGIGLGTIKDDGTGPVPPGITPDNDTPAASINDVVVNEAAGTATFTVTLTNAAAMPVMVDYATADGTAKAGMDYAAVASTLTFAPGETSKTISVSILNDSVYEGSETFTINLSVPVNTTIADGAGLGMIKDDGTGSGGVDNDTPHLVWRRMDDVNEGVGRAVFVLELSNPSDLPVSVHYETKDGVALAGADYIGASGVLTFAPGEMSKIVPIDIVNDGVYEGREDFGLVLSSPVNAVIDRPDVTVGVLDDGGGVGPSPLTPGWVPDDDRPRISVGDVVVNEGAVMAEFRVTLSNPAAMPVTVHYATQDGTALAGADYAPTAGMLVVPAGVTEMVVRVPILNDVVYEGQESFRLVLSDPANAVLAKPIGAGLIRDDGQGNPPPVDLMPVDWTPDNDTPRVSVGTTNVLEDAGYNVFAVRIDHPSAEAIQVALVLKDIEATRSADYGPDLSYSLDHGLTWVSGSVLPFAPGVTEVMARTSIVSDGVSEFDERFTVQANVISGITVNQSASGDVTIIDVTPAPEISVSGVTVNESDLVASFYVTLSAPSVYPVTVDYVTTAGSAMPGTDYVGQSGTITFAPGEVSKTVGIPIVDDMVSELRESFGLSIFAPVGGVLRDATAVAGIIDNDAAPVASDDAGAGLEDVIQTGNVLWNDVDPNGDLISVTGFSVGGVLYLPGAVAAIAGVGDFTLRVDGSYAFTPVANYNGAVPLVSYDITDGANPASAVLILSVTPVNDAPVVGASSVNVSEEGGVAREGVSPGNPDAAGVMDTTNSLRGVGVLPISDVEGGPLTVTWSGTQPDVYQARSGGQALLLQWGSYDPALFRPASGALNNLIVAGGGGAVSSAVGALGGGKTLLLTNGDVPIMALEIDDAGNYQVWLSAFYGHIKHLDKLAEDILALGLGVDVSDGSQVTSAVLTVNVEDDSPIATDSSPVTVEAGASVSSVISFAAGADGPHQSVSLVVDGVTYTPTLNNFWEITGVQTDPSGSPVAFTTEIFSVTTAAGGLISLNVLTRAYSYTAPASVPAGYVESIGYIVRDRDGDAAQAALSFDVQASPLLPTVSVSDAIPVGDYSSGGVLSFEITLSAPSASAVSVQYATVDGTASSELVPQYPNNYGVPVFDPLDFASKSGSVTFLPGETSKTVNISVSRDVVYEQTENMSLVLSSPVNATVADGSAVGEIIQTSTPVIGISPWEGSKDDGYAYFSAGMNWIGGSSTGAQFSVAIVPGFGAVGGGVDYFDTLEISYDDGLTWVAGPIVNLRPTSLSGEGMSSFLTDGIRYGGTEAVLRVQLNSSAPPHFARFNLIGTNAPGSPHDWPVDANGELFNIESTILARDIASTAWGVDPASHLNETFNLTPGVDLITYGFADQGAVGAPSIDTFNGYSVVDGDVISLSLMLRGERINVSYYDLSRLENYLDFVVNGPDTEIRISTKGEFTGGVYDASKEDQRIILTGIDLFADLGVGYTDSAIIADMKMRGLLETDIL